MWYPARDAAWKRIAGEGRLMLSPYRVLDLTDERGLICGQILADLGADVIAVEPPGGSPARRRGPFAGDAADPERSLTWWAYARGKRSITLDLESTGGRDELRRLVRGSDVLIESADAGRMDALGLGHANLEREHPGLVYVSISAFGQDGPKAHYAATDITVSAAAGPSAFIGDEDRAPLRFGVPQAFLHAGAEAADAALIALRERRHSGRGQHVDVSAQQAFAQATQSTILAVAIGEQESKRLRGGASLGPLFLPLVWRAQDGYVSLTFFFGSAIGPFSARLMHWIHEQGGCDQSTRDKDWVGFAAALMSGAESVDEYRRVLALVATFLRGKTKAELLDAALERRLLITPMATIPELLASPQFADRDYWRAIEQPQIGRAVAHPGAFARFGTRPIANWRRAPSIGEHGDALRAELLAAPAPDIAPDRTGARGDTDSRAALAGVKVLDLMWVMAGPAATRVLADYGATVVKIESTSHVDTARTIGPFHGGQPGPESSGLYLNMNAAKLGLTLDLSNPQGRDVFLDLVRWADVVTESFSPKAMRAWGLDYDSLLKVNPQLIMLSSSLFGQSGPLSSLAGFGTMGAAAAGFNSVIGWPDRDPAMVAAYTDYVSPRFTVAALLAALDHRDRSGEGQYIDFSQAEASLHFLAPALLDYTVNGRVAGRIGNTDPQMAPHAIYPAAGGDRWVAISVADEAQWGALCRAIGRAELIADARFGDPAARLAHTEALDAIVTEWTSVRDAQAIEAALQAQGVPAHSVDGSARLVNDPQLLHRGHFVRLEHPVHGTTTVEGSRAHLSRTPARIERAAPTFGRDNFEVLTEILGYDAERVAELAAADVLR